MYIVQELLIDDIIKSRDWHVRPSRYQHPEVEVVRRALSVGSQPEKRSMHGSFFRYSCRSFGYTDHLEALRVYAGTNSF
jgi:hypothetical protein